MAQRLFGLIPTTDVLPFAQQAYYLGGPSLPNNSGWVGYTIGTFQMPWDGELYAHLTTVYSFTGHQQVAQYLSGSPGPAMNATYNHIAIIGSGSLRGQMPLYGRWTNLIRNQVVTLTLMILSGGGGSAVACEVISGTARAVRVAP
jgi:hypothetical protein